MKSLAIVIAILALSLTVIACDDDPCNCNPKDHLGIDETCCGKKGCKCELKEYGKIAGIPIYRENGVTNDQAITAEENIQEGYLSVYPAVRGNINTTKVSAIIITATDTIDSCTLNDEGKYIIKIAENRVVGYVAGTLENYATYTLAQLHQSNNIYLASPDYSSSVSSVLSVVNKNKRSFV